MREGTCSEDCRPWRLYLAILLGCTTFLRLIYLIKFCPLDLAPDEAHYWDWSRHLDWSYYSKGPLIAWIIRAGIELFGPLSIALTGNEMMAVRLPALFFGTATLLALYILAVQTLRSERTAFFTVLFLVATPFLSTISLLMTIDSPFLCIWSWTLVVGCRAVFREERWAWLLTGALLGLGILAKYTMALWLFSFGMFVLVTPSLRPTLFRSRSWLMVLVASLSALPILIWNANHDWVTFRHVAGQAGVPTATRNTGLRWFGPLEFVAGQFALLIGYWFVVWICALIQFRPTRTSDLRIRYLWWMSVPTFLVFLASSFKAGGQINWPVAAYLSGSILMTAWILQRIDAVNTASRNLARTGVILACSLCLVLTIVSHETRMARPMLREVAVRLKADDPYSIRRVDPTCRLKGWQALGKELDSVRREVAAAEGVEPILAGPGWNIPGEIGFYCEGHPKVYSFGPYYGDRHSQYDFWRPNPVSDPEQFNGRTFIVINGHPGILSTLFQHSFQVKEFIYREGDVPIATWTIWIGRGFRGHDQLNSKHRENY